jgi:CheY-like chemotaxis protein
MRPVVAADAIEALDVLDRASAPGELFPIAIVDCDMPGMDGMALAEEMHRRYQSGAPRVVLLSTASRIRVGTIGRELPIAGKLIKPVLPFQIADAVMLSLGQNAPSEAAPKQTAALVGTSASPEGLRVLVAEDNRVNQEVARRLLEKRGCRVVIAGDGLEAVEAFRNDIFDVILMDVQMPVLEGFESTKRIRVYEAGKSHIPIIALTANVMSGDRERCLAAGMDGFLSKPIRAEDLFEEIRRVVRADFSVAR